MAAVREELGPATRAGIGSRRSVPARDRTRGKDGGKGERPSAS